MAYDLLDSHSTEEIQATRKSFSPFPNEDYIGKIFRIDLISDFPYKDTSGTMLKFHVGIALYKFKAEDGLFDENKKSVKPLTRTVFKILSSMSEGSKQNGEPAFVRAIIGYITGQDVTKGLVVKRPAAMLIDKGNPRAEKMVTDKKIIQQYAEERGKLRNGEILLPDCELYGKDRYEDCADIRPLVGKYISVKLQKDSWEKDGVTKYKNKIIEFGKVPSNFKPDPSIDTEEAMEKVNKDAHNYMEKKKDSNYQKPKEASIMEDANIEDIEY